MSNLSITGVIHQIQDLQKGTKKNGEGEWVRQNFVIKTTSENGQYEDFSPFTMYNPETIDRFRQFNKEGDTVEVSFNIKGREYEGRWYTDLVAWRVYKENPNAAPATALQEHLAEEEFEDDLPF